MHVRTTFKQSILFIQWALLLASNIGKVEYHSCPTGLLLVFLGAAKYKISYVPVHLQAFFFFFFGYISYLTVHLQAASTLSCVWVWFVVKFCTESPVHTGTHWMDGLDL